MRRIAPGLAGLVLIATAAVPAPAIASAHPAAHHSALARTCDPSSGSRTYYSYDKWSKGNAYLCVSVLERANGTKAIQADFSADFFYYWGAAWYSDGDCVFGCHLTGNFHLRKNYGAPNLASIGETNSGNHGKATHTFQAGSGHYQLTAGVTKQGGYWRNHDHPASSQIPMNAFKITLDIP